jgi:HEAT repeat protein
MAGHSVNRPQWRRFTVVPSPTELRGRATDAAVPARVLRERIIRAAAENYKFHAVTPYALDALRHIQTATGAELANLLLGVPAKATERSYRISVGVLVDVLGPLGASAVQPIAALLQGQDREKRRKAAYLCRFLGQYSGLVMPTLIAGLDDSDTDFPIDVAWTLGAIGPAAAFALPRLRALMHCGQYDLAIACAWAILEIAKGDAAIDEILPEMLLHQNARVFMAATNYMRRIEPMRSVPLICSTIPHVSADRRVTLTASLARFGPSAAAALLLLTRQLYDLDRPVRSQTAYALTQIKDSRAIESLLEALQKEETAEIRRSFCWAILKLSEAAIESGHETSSRADVVWRLVVPALVEARSGDKAPLVRLQAIEALERLGADANHKNGALGEGPPIPQLSEKAATKAAQLRKQLHTFCLVGEVCEKPTVTSFTCAWMAKQLLQRFRINIGSTTLRNHLSIVQSHFRDHLPDLGILFDGGQGQRGFTITPSWWVAWRIAMQTIGGTSVRDAGWQTSKAFDNGLPRDDSQ